MTEFARRDEPRAGLEHDRSAQDNVVDDHVPGRLGMEYLFDPLIERHQCAQAEDHHRDDKDPEIELQPIAEGMLRVGRLLGAAHAEAAGARSQYRPSNESLRCTWPRC